MTLLDRRVSRAHVTAFNAGFMSAQDVRSPKITNPTPDNRVLRCSRRFCASGLLCRPTVSTVFAVYCRWFCRVRR